MSSDESRQLLQARLVPEVGDFKIGAYHLADDMARLAGVRKAGAIEAGIFYGARILEVLSGSAVQAIGLPLGSSVFSNLESLAQFSLMPHTTHHWANALRRLGNDVRHVLRPTSHMEGELAALFAERWIEWYFCRFRLGPGLAHLTSDGLPIFPTDDADLPVLLRAIDDDDFDPMAWLPARWAGAPPYMAASTVAAVIANLLLDRGETKSAFEVLMPAHERFPDDLRILQLMLLGYKRLGDLQNALDVAGPLVARSRDDDETAGIVAGVYKQVYLDRGRDADMLAKSHRAYRGGWEQSKSSNAYLGINAAATAAWLGRETETRRLAGEVKGLLVRRFQTMAARERQTHLTISYWDQVTLAEAQLLLGELAEAKARYMTAFTQSSKSRGSVKVATEQADRNLTAIGLTLAPGEFFNRTLTPVEGEALIVGVSGHRALLDETPLRDDVVTLFRRLLAEAGAPGKPMNLSILSSLAAGADCLVAEVGLNQFDAHLRVVLPLEIVDYRNDFSAQETARFQSLLNRADEVIYPPSPPARARGAATPAEPTDPAAARNAAYERAGFYVVDHCQVLIALWDGQSSRGRGGTADVVAHAKSIGRRVEVIDTPRDGE